MPDIDAIERSQRRSARLRTWIQAQAAELDKHDALPLRNQLLVFLGAALAIISRCPSLFYRAQFYAEDAVIWYRQAYSGGWLHALWITDAGYLQFIQRAGAGIALLVPFRWAPLTMAICGLLVQCLPIPLLLSSRCRNWGPLSLRALYIAIYIALPNAREIHVNLTNSQWHLGLFTVLLAFAMPPRTWQGRAGDVAYLLFAGFCGPFGIALLPFVVVSWLIRRQNWSLAVAASLAVGGATQLVEFSQHPNRVHAFLGAGVMPFLRIVGGDIITNSMLGGYPFTRYIPSLLLALAAIGGIALYLYCLRFAKLELKLFILFSGLLLAAALRSPMIEGPKPLWESLADTASGRYWFFPMLAFLWGAAWCFYFARHRFFHMAGKLVLLTMMIGVVDNWEYRPYPDEHFPQWAKTFRAAEAGTHIVIPITPKNWKVDLVKKEPAGQD